MNRVPRILWLIKGLGLGGAERLICSSLPYFHPSRFDVEVAYLLPWKDALVPQIQRLNTKVSCLNVTSRNPLSAVRAVSEFLKTNEFDLIHTHLGMSSIAGRLAARRRGVPAIIHTEHGSCARMHWMMRMANRLTLGMNDATIAVSDDVARSMNAGKCRLEVIQNGIDCAELQATPSDRDEVRSELGISSESVVICKVANLSPVKNHEMLIRAFACLEMQNDNPILLLVGQLRGREEFLRQVAKEHGVAQRVIIAGPRTDVPRLLKAADIFAMSSHSEGLPVSLLEAMALSKPVVCTRVGGIPGVITEGVEGFLVPLGQPDQMAARLQQLSDSKQLRERLGRAGCEKVVAHHDVRVMAERTAQIYQQVLKEKGFEFSDCSIHRRLETASH